MTFPLLEMQWSIVTDDTLEAIARRIALCQSTPGVISGTREELERAMEQIKDLDPDLQTRLRALADDFAQRFPTAE